MTLTQDVRDFFILHFLTPNIMVTRRTSAESRRDRENLQAELVQFIKTGGHWSDLVPALGLQEFGDNGYLNNTPSGAEVRAEKLAKDANQGKVVHGVQLTADNVRAALGRLSA